MKKNFEMINNLKITLDTMIPGDYYMPKFSKAEDIKIILNKFKYDKNFIKILKDKKKMMNKENQNFFEKNIEKEIVEIYFTSNSAIKALDLRKKIFLKDKKKEDLLKLTKKIKNKNKIFRK